jgi:hypothetical protein
MQTKKQFRNKAVLISLTIISLLSISLAQNSSPLDAVPQDAVFCVKINNLDNTLGQFDQFLTGLAPMPSIASMMVRMRLTELLGDPALSGVNTAGVFVIFGVPAKQQNESDKTKDICGAMLMPVKDYAQFLELSANVGEADSNGVSKITTQPMETNSGKGKTAISVKVKDYALIGAERNYAQILALATSISDGSAGSMSKSLDAEQAKLSNEMPIWAYGDIDKINKTFGPLINDALAKAQAEIEKKSQKPGMMMGNASEMMKIYFDAAKAFLEQGKFASLSIKPEPSVLRIKKTVAAKADTEMAKLLISDPALPKDNPMLGYLEDGSAINCSAKISQAAMKKMTQFGMNFIKAAPGMTSAEEKIEWEQTVNSSMQSIGNMIMMSLKTEAGNKPPFGVKYLVELKDPTQFQTSQDKVWEMMGKGAMADMYKQMGLAIEASTQKNTAQYKDVSIDSAMLKFKAVDANSPEAQMIASMYGEGFVYKIAYADKYYAMVMGGDTDTEIKQLIDQIKAGPKEPSGEVSAAMGLLPDAKTADIFGTLNMIRLMNMGMSFAPMPISIPFDQIPTKTNIAFAAKAADGKLTADIAIPKEHLMEIMAIAMVMQQSQAQGYQPEQ